MSADELYRKIKTLQGTLAGRESVSKRRKAGHELVTILIGKSTWKKLGGALSVPKARAAAKNFRRKALSGIFSVALRNVVQFVRSFTSAQTKAKLALEDTKLPHALLQSLKRNHLENLLVKDDAVCLLDFCMDMLEDVPEDDPANEALILETLALTCSLKACVIHFRPDKHMLAILDEVYNILSRDTIEEAVLRQTVQVFKNLISTADELGIDLHLLLRISLEMIASTASRIRSGIRHHLTGLVSGAAILMRASPDLAVNPLKEHGSALMTLAKEFFQPGDRYGATETSEKILLDEYFSAHILVCQVAGQLQGRMPGDLGDIGDASLTSSEFVKLIDLLEKRKHSAPALWARILSRTQRIDLCTAEWDEVDNHADMFERIIGSRRGLDDYFCLERHAPPHIAADCSSEALAATQYVSRVLKPLLVAAKLEQVRGNSHQPKGLYLRWKKALDIASVGGERVQSREVVSKLMIISACTVLYPLGACWASNSQNHWYDIPGADDRLEPSKAMGGSFVDLAATVDTVGSLLKACVKMKEGLVVQDWTLRCLSCLAVATRALDLVGAPNRSYVETSWRAVWSILFQSDLPYLFLTKSTKENVRSDSILRLLVQLVRFRCAGDFRTFDVHDLIWKLPAFTSFPESPLLFQLVFAVLRVYGLSDDGTDVIGEGTGSQMSPTLGTDRRARLAGYCINYLQHACGTEKLSISPATHCLVALLYYDRPPPWNHIFEAEFPDDPVASLFLGIGKAFFPCKRFEGFVRSRLPVRSAEEIMEQLWEIGDVRLQEYLPDETDDFTSATACSIFAEMVSREQKCDEAEPLKRPLAVQNVLDAIRTARMSNLQHQDEHVLSKLLLLKIQVSVSLVAGASPDIEEFNKVVSFVSESLASISLSETTSFHDRDEWNSSLKETVLVCKSIVLFARVLRVDLRDTDFANVAPLIYSTCSQILNQYRVHSVQSCDFPETTALSDASADDNSEDEESYVASSGGAKRRKSSNSLSSKKRKTTPVPSSFISSDGARLAATLVLTLNPTAADLDSSARALLGVDDMESEDIDPSDTVDVFELIHSLRFLPVIPPPSVPVLLSKLSQRLRSDVEPHLAFHLFGFDSFARYMASRDCLVGTASLDSSVTKSIVSAQFCDDRQARKSLSLRSFLRLAQLNGAQSVFRNTDPGVHEEMDRHFPAKFVLPYLSSLNRNVRRTACIGAAHMMIYQQSDNRSIVRDVHDKLVPAVGNASKYRQWCSAFVNSLNEDEESTLAEVESNSWNDARKSFNRDIKMLYWPCISANDRELRQKLVFDMILTAGEKPRTQLLCFQAIERMALHSGYRSAEVLIDHENRHLCKSWLALGKSLYDIPLVWCAPSVCRKILISGQSANEELLTSGDSFLTSFMERSLNHFLPQIVLNTAVAVVDARETLCRREAFQRNDAIRQISELSGGNCDHEQLLVVLDKAYDAVMAKCAVMHLTLDCDIKVAAEALALMRNLFPDYAKRNKQWNSRVCKIATELLGQDIAFGESIDFEKVMRVLQAVLDRAPCNPVELVVFANFLLADCSTELDARARWKVLDGLIRHGTRIATLGVVPVYASCLIGIIETPNWSFLREAAFDTVIHVTQTIIESPFGNAFLASPDAQDIFGCMFDHHVLAQKQVAALLEQYQETEHNTHFDSCLLGTPTLQLDHERHCDPESTERLLPAILGCEQVAMLAASTMRKTYEVVKVFLHSGGAFRLQLNQLVYFGDEDFSHKALLDVLRTNDIAFAIQNLADEIDDESKESDNEPDLTTLGSLTNGTVLATQLLRIEMDLTKGLYRNHDLLPFCLGLCSRQNPAAVRTAAARCIGEMEILTSKFFEGTAESFSAESLSSNFQLSVIRTLIKCVKGRSPREAEIACETIKAVCEVMETCPRELQDLLYALTESGNTSLAVVRLSDQEILNMRGDGGCSEGWCWGSSIWSLDSSIGQSFESWISHVTMALLDCYYKESATNKDRLFLSKCHRMCLFDATFATTAFPAIIVGLLNDPSLNPPFDEDRTDINRVSLETWVGQPTGPINEALSKAFTLFLSNAVEQKDRRFLNVAVDTIDQLRMLTQARFLSAPHKRKSCDSPDDYGVYIPFGTVLKLDGRLVVQACIAASRYEQALFYAELFGDVRFGGSTVVDSSQTSGKSWLTTDISGFGVFQGHSSVSYADEYADRSTYFTLIAQGFEGLGDTESKIAIERVRADLDFCDYRTDIASAAQVTQSFYKLQMHENFLSQNSHSQDAKSSFLESLEELELLNGMEAFVQSLRSNTDGAASNMYDSDVLAEKNQQCRLFERGWDDSCFSTDRGIEMNSGIPNKSDPNQTGGFFYLMNEVLDSLATRNVITTRDSLHNIRMACLDEFSTTGKSNMALLQFSERMHLLNSLSSVPCQPSSTTSLLERFSKRLWVTPLSSCVEETSLRVLLASETDDDKFSLLAKSLKKHLEHTFDSTLTQGRHKAAHGALKRLSTVYQYLDQNEGEGVTERLLSFRLREARLMERIQNTSGAIASTICAMNALDPKNQAQMSPGAAAVRVDALTLCGEWTAKYKVEPAATVLKKYVENAKTLARDLWTDHPSAENAKRLGRALASQSLLANNLFNGALAKTRSIDWTAAGESLELRKQRLQQREKNDKSLKAGKTKQEQSEITLTTNILRDEIKATSKARKRLEDKMEEHRVLALEALVASLKLGACDESDSSRHVYQLVSMLFSCHEEGKWSQAIEELGIESAGIPSFRFVPLFTQMLSRLATPSKSTQQFQIFLRNLIARVAAEHPYHCLVPLLALSTQESKKATVANEILIDIEKNDPKFVGQLLDGYRKLAAAYTHLAMVDVSSLGKGKQVSFDGVCKRDLRLDRCVKQMPCPPCILTKPPPIQPDGRYGNGTEDPIGGERIASFDGSFTVTASGLSCPRIVNCIGTKGGRYKQLIKGNDDTRQDAVMEQVFGYVNELLAKPIEGKRQGYRTGKELRLATYTVVPLSRKAGVIEFVENAPAFGDFVKGSRSRPGAHQRYFPHQQRYDKVASKLRDVQQKKGDQKRVYEEELKKFSPVYRFFFVEKFGHAPEQWYAARTNFTRSLAVNSIVGHILGIGDRHTNNILIQQKTGELLHIDFGFVFEQGKGLPCPERVPFRLTQNLVDGMGPLGTTGVFRAAAERTMEILQKNSGGLLTILSAIASDPLYKWTLDERALSAPTKGQRKQSTTTTETHQPQNNAEAAQAIARIDEKLKGYEDGTDGEQQSVESQVALLVHQAQATENLSHMYYGWAAYI